MRHVIRTGYSLSENSGAVTDIGHFVEMTRKSPQNITPDGWVRDVDQRPMPDTASLDAYTMPCVKHGGSIKPQPVR